MFDVSLLILPSGFTSHKIDAIAYLLFSEGSVKLPFDSLIASEKLTRYLLVERKIGDKSNFLKQGGYTQDNWEQLERDIRQQILPEDAVLIEETDYGQLFEIRASLRGPTGTTLKVKSVWMQESETGMTKFITLYPDK
jgi:hypothetical protein